MTIRDASLLAARLLALFFIVDALRYVGLIISRLLDTPFDPKEWLEMLAYPVVILFAGVIIWATARSFAESVALDAMLLSDAEETDGGDDDLTEAAPGVDPVDDDAEYVHRIEIDDADDDAGTVIAPPDGPSTAAWLMLGIVLIGVWTVARALPNVAYSISALTQDSGNLFGNGFAEQQRAEAIRQIVNSIAQLAVGLILIVGKATLVGWLMKLRSPSASQPVDTDAQ